MEKIEELSYHIQCIRMSAEVFALHLRVGVNLAIFWSYPKLQITVFITKIWKMSHRKHHLTTHRQPTGFSESQQSSASFVKCHGKLNALALSTESCLSNLKTCNENCLNNNPSLTEFCIGSLTQEQFWFTSTKAESENNLDKSSTSKFKNLRDVPCTKYIQANICLHVIYVCLYT